MNVPSWASDPSLDESTRQKMLLNYRLRVAALHHNPHGSLTELSVAAGFFRQHLHMCISRGTMSRKAELAVRAVIGEDVFPALEPTNLNDNEL